MAVLNLHLLGDLQMRSEKGALVAIPAKKSQALLAYLGLRPTQPVSRDKIAGLLWSSTGPDQARQSLRQTLSTLRKDLAQISPSAKILVEEGDFLSLDPAIVDTDAAHFESLVARGKDSDLREAVELYHGDFLDGFALDEERFDQWTLAERDRLRRMALRAHATLSENAARAGSIDDAILYAQRSLRIEPLQESVHRTLMRLFMQSGDHTTALQQYDMLAKMLRRELGAEPDAETRALQQEISRARTKRAAGPEAAAPDSGKPTILVVEDNVLNRELANAVLTTAGYSVVLAKDGAEALMEVGRRNVDLILLDIDLPFIDGHHVLQALREKGIDVPTIFVSGLPGEQPELKALELGAADFIHKPVKNNVLLARVAKVLRKE
jgi:DNA-binding SARP family transcriptional activator